MSSQDALDMDHTALLSSAALKALELRQQPFRSIDSTAAQEQPNGLAASAPGNQLFSDETTAEQLADIKQALITGDDLLLILGEEGSGKTTLLEQLDTNSGLRIQCFPVQGTDRFSTVNLFAGMLEAFKIEPPDKLKEVLDELIPCLQQMVGKNTLSTIVLDDAQTVNQTELTQLLSGMLYINSQDETLMRVALAAPPDFEGRIPDLLPEGADMPYSSLTIEGYNSQRASAYLAHRLQDAGFDGEFPFTDRDMASLVEHSGGMPGELHALTADVLNEKFGRIEDSLPPELLASNSDGFLQSRIGKLVLGALATLLILFGLMMFMQGSDSDNSDLRNTVASNADNRPAAEELKLIEEDKPGVTVTATEDAVTTTGNDNQTLSEAASSETQNTTAPDNEKNSAESIITIVPNAQNPDNQNANNLNNELAQPPVENAPTAQPADVQTPAETEKPVEIDSARAEQESDNGDGITQAVAELAPQQASDSASNSTDAADAPGTEPPISPEDAELAQRLESPNWILLQDPSQYTIQMSASRERASVENFLRQNPLPAPNSIFSFERDGVVWHALAHGIYSSIEDARLAVERMPEPALRDQPWIRSIRRVQSILKTP